MNGGADPQVKPYHALNLAAQTARIWKNLPVDDPGVGNHMLSGKYK